MLSCFHSFSDYSLTPGFGFVKVLFGSFWFILVHPSKIGIAITTLYPRFPTVTCFCAGLVGLLITVLYTKVWVIQSGYQPFKFSLYELTLLVLCQAAFPVTRLIPILSRPRFLAQTIRRIGNLFLFSRTLSAGLLRRSFRIPSIRLFLLSRETYWLCRRSGTSHQLRSNKCWYYEQAIKDGSEDRLKSLIPDHLPEGIQKAYENAHS